MVAIGRMLYLVLTGVDLLRGCYRGFQIGQFGTPAGAQNLKARQIRACFFRRSGHQKQLTLIFERALVVRVQFQRFRIMVSAGFQFAGFAIGKAQIILNIGIFRAQIGRFAQFEIARSNCSRSICLMAFFRRSSAFGGGS